MCSRSALEAVRRVSPPALLTLGAGQFTHWTTFCMAMLISNIQHCLIPIKKWCEIQHYSILDIRIKDRETIYFLTIVSGNVCDTCQSFRVRCLKCRIGCYPSLLIPFLSCQAYPITSPGSIWRRERVNSCSKPVFRAMKIFWEVLK